MYKEDAIRLKRGNKELAKQKARESGYQSPWIRLFGIAWMILHLVWVIAYLR